jgi:hypothetical protein
MISSPCMGSPGWHLTTDMECTGPGADVVASSPIYFLSYLHSGSPAHVSPLFLAPSPCVSQVACTWTLSHPPTHWPPAPWSSTPHWPYMAGGRH